MNDGERINYGFEENVLDKLETHHMSVSFSLAFYLSFSLSRSLGKLTRK